MTLNQLEYFCAVGRTHSITRAAEELFVSQPTISVAIRDLEREFHLQLVNHEKNRISLTTDGEYFYERASRLLGDQHAFLEDFSAMGKSVRPVKLGIPPLISTFFFPRMADSFQEATGIPIQLFEYGSVRACQLVNRGDLDAAFVNMDAYTVDNFYSHVLMSDQTILCVSRTHRFAKEPKVTVEMLWDEPLVFYNTDAAMNRTMYARFRSKGMVPNIIMYSSQLYTTLNYVRRGDCAAFLYSSLAINPRDFVQVPLEPEYTTDFGIVWPKTHLREETRKFVEFAQQYTPIL